MEEIRRYIIGLLAASCICSILNVWVSSKGAGGTVIKLISGLFMIITLISPLVSIRLQDFSGLFAEYTVSGHEYIQSGKNHAALAMGDIIKQQTQAYILDKAASMGLDVEVEVTLSETEPTVPDTVVLKGQVSPYGKMQLMAAIEEQLGITREKQLWE